ncbi:MBL fold metallo-hydrolase [Oceanidesulfovibrio indonesiensis]|nr:MBL fold metallo-hydrolase [Oceanidesulfovibrio indonesiensis]
MLSVNISTREELKNYWLKNYLSSTANYDKAATMKVREELIPIAEGLGFEDWWRYLKAMEDYTLGSNLSEERLQDFMDWALEGAAQVDEWLLAHGLLCLGSQKGENGNVAGALFDYDMLLLRFRGHKDCNIQVVVAKTLTNVFSYVCDLGESLVIWKMLQEIDIDQGVEGYLEEFRIMESDCDDSQIQVVHARMLYNAICEDFRFNYKLIGENHLKELRELALKNEKDDIYAELATALFVACDGTYDEFKIITQNVYLQELRDLADDRNEERIWEELAKALTNAIYFTKQDALPEAEKCLAEVRKIYKHVGSETILQSLCYSLVNMAIIYEAAEDLFLAYDYFMEALAILDEKLTGEKDFYEQVFINTKRLFNKLRSQVDSDNGQKRKRLKSFKSRTKRTTNSLPLRTGIIRHLDDCINDTNKTKKTKKTFLDSMEKRKERVKRFLDPNGRFKKDASVLMVLRQWNSYTPIIVDGEESDRGGGYFIRHKNLGLVIDPGYNFIELFHKAGAKIADITHIAISHAHDDHTAQLEQLMTMLYQYNKQNNMDHEKDSTKKITLLLNHSSLKKFSGFSWYRGCPYIKKLIALNAFDSENAQTIELEKGSGFSLTVLPAYHDDLFTTDYAIGIGICLDYGDITRRLVFTADTGLYPTEFDSKGHSIKHSNEYGEESRVNDAEDEGVNRRYPLEFQSKKVDLLIPHLGSVKEYEFSLPKMEREESKSEKLSSDRYSMPLFYSNHLGLRGTAVVIKEIQPKAVILSEFGAELKGLRMEIVDLLSEALSRAIDNDQLPFIIPGDPGLVYDIRKCSFLCHEDGQFYDPVELELREGDEERILLIMKGSRCASAKRLDNTLSWLVNGDKPSVSFEPLDIPYFDCEL